MNMRSFFYHSINNLIYFKTQICVDPITMQDANCAIQKNYEVGQVVIERIILKGK